MERYVYCFCADPALMIQGTAGIDGSQIHCIEYDGIVAVTTDSSRRPDPSSANVLAHNRVVNSILRVTTPVPCRFGTVLSRRDLDAYVQVHGTALKSLLEKFRGCLEMTLRITRGGQDAVKDASKDSSSFLKAEIQARGPRLLSDSRGPGTRFLEEKLRQAVRKGIANQEAQAIVDWAERHFGAAAKESVARLTPESSLVADIAHLVERACLDDYHDLFKSAAKDRPDLKLSLSGPWAPYSFAASVGPRRLSAAPGVSLFSRGG